MDDLIAFLRARFDEDEASARTWEAACIHIEACHDTGDFLHRFREERIVDEIDAKRKLLELHQPMPSGYRDGRYVHPDPGDPACAHCDDLCHCASGTRCESPDAPWPCATVRLIALPYAGHPDYREEWRP